MDVKAIRGIPWTLLSYGLTKGLTVVTTIVLARLLVPHDFGLVALATLATGVFAVFGNLGLGASVIVRDDLGERALGTVLTVMVASTALMTAVVAALAPVFADVFDEPRLSSVLAVLSLTIVLGAPGWLLESVLQRELEFRRRFVAQMAQAAVYAATAIALAATGAGVWSIVAGQLAGTAVWVATLVALSPVRLRPRYDHAEARSSLSAGSGFLWQGGLAFVQQNVDYFAVGRLAGAGPLGLYSMAYRLGELPYLAIVDPIAKVTFPAFARMRERRDALHAALLSTLRLVALLTAPLCIVLSGAAEPFVRGVLGERWTAMSSTLAIFGIWALLRGLHGTLSWYLNSIGEAGLMARLSAIVLVPFVPALLVAADRGGIDAVAGIMVLEAMGTLAVFSIFVSRRGGIAVGRQWRALAPVGVACPPCWLVTWGVAEATSGWSPLVSLVVSGPAGGLAFLVAIAVLAPDLLRQAGAQARRAVGAAAPAGER